MQNFSITILPNPSRIELDRSLDPESTVEGEWNEGEGYLQLKAEITRSEEVDFNFLLLDDYTGIGIPNVPMWLQIGYTPNSMELDQMEGGWADSSSDYLFYQDPDHVPFEWWYKPWIQGKTERPIVYPFSEEAWKMYGPMYYQMAETDGEGKSSFHIPADLLLTVYEDYMTHMQQSLESIEDVQLYVRVFYDSDFDPQYMQLPQTYGNYPIEYDHPEYVYDSTDEVYDFDGRQYHHNYQQNSSYGEGYITLKKETVGIMAQDTVISGGQPFWVSAQIWEMDESPLGDGSLLPESTGPHNFIDTYKDVNETFALTMEVYDSYNTTKVLDGRWIECLGSWISYKSYCDGEGVVSFYLGYESLGTQFDRLIPGTYTLNFYGEGYSGAYRLEGSGSAMLTILSRSSYTLDNPSHIYSLVDLLDTDPNTAVYYDSAYVNTTQLYQDSQYPVITADINIEALTEIANPSANYDNIQINCYQNDYLLEESFTIYNTSSVETEKLVIPLHHYIGDLNLSFEVIFIPDVDSLINWTEIEIENQTFLDTWYDRDPEDFAAHYEDGEEYWQAVENQTKNEFYSDYQFSAPYRVVIGNLTLHESLHRLDGQFWNLSGDLMNPGYYNTPMYCDYNSGPSGQWVGLDSTVYGGFDLTQWVGYTEPYANYVAQMLSVNTHQQIEFLFNQSEYQLNAGILNYSVPLMAAVDLTGLPYIEPWHHNLTQDRLYGNTTLQTFGGYLLNDTWDRAVRTGVYNRSNFDGSLGASDDLVYMNLRAGETISIQSEHLYIPYEGSYDLQMFAPFFGEMPVMGEMPLFEVTLQIQSEHDPSVIFTHTVGLGSGDLNTDYHGLFEDLSVNIPDYLYSHSTTVSLNVTVVQGTIGSEVNAFGFLKGFLMGEETIIQVSDVYPSGLREQFFSTLFQYFYTEQAKSWGARNTPETLGGANAINDIYYELEGYTEGGLMIKDLSTILSVQNQRQYWNIAYDHDFEHFEYSPTILSQLFGNYENKATFDEFSPQDDAGVSMLKLSFNEGLMHNITEPSVYSGFINLYNVPESAPSDPALMEKMKSRKFTVIVYPSVWQQQPQGMTLLKGEDANYLTPGGTLQADSYWQNHLRLDYSMPAGSEDVVINDWSTSFKKADAVPLPTDKFASVSQEELFYDDLNYITFNESVQWDSDTQLVNYEDVSVQMMSISPNHTLFQMPAPALFAKINQNHYDYCQIPLQFLNTSRINAVTATIHLANGNTFTSSISNPAAYSQRSITLDMKDNLQDMTQLDLAFTIDGENWTPDVANAIDVGLLGLGFFKNSSVGSIDLTTLTGNPLDPFKDVGPYYVLPSVFTAELVPEVLMADLPIDSLNAGEIYNLHIQAPEFIDLSLYALNIYADVSDQDAYKSNLDALELYSLTPYDMTREIFSYNFDTRERNQELRMASFLNPLITPATLENPWQGNLQDFSIPAINLTNYDFNGDCRFDLAIESTFGGSSITYDFQADGKVEYQQLVKNHLTVGNISEMNMYGDGYYYIAESQYVAIEERYDTDGNGVFDYSNEYFYSAMSEAIPNYYSSYYNRDVYTPYENWTYSSPGTFGFVRKEDTDGDGTFDHVVNRQDLWDNRDDLFSDMEHESEVENAMFETYYDSTTEEAPVFALGNYSDPFREELVGWEAYYDFMDKAAALNLTVDLNQTDTTPMTTVLQGNSIEVYSQFTLLGCEPGGGTNISGDFIWQHDIAVPVDNRLNIADYLKTDPHGSIAWFSSFGNGLYDLAFIFSETSLEENQAIAVYISREHDRVVRTGKALEFTPDLFVPTWHMSSQIGFDIIRAQAVSDTDVNFKAQLQDTEYWGWALADTLVQSGIQLLAPILGTITPIPPSIWVVGLNSLYQYGLRNTIETTINHYDPTSAQALGTENRPLSTKIMDGWKEGGWDLLDDMGLYSFSGVDFFESRIMFNNSSPFDNNLSVNIDHESYITVEIPKLFVEDIVKSKGVGAGLIDSMNELFVRQTTTYGFFLQIGEGKPYANLGEFIMSELHEFGSLMNDMCPDLFRLTAGVTSEDEAEEIFANFENITNNERKFVHQAYWRTPATVSPLNYDYQFYYNAIGTAEQWLATSKAYSNILMLTNPQGSAFVVPSYGPDLNYSNPVAYAVDYQLLCIQSLYNTELEWAMENNGLVAAVQFLQGMISTAISVPLGKLGGARANNVKFSQMGFSVADVFDQIKDELIVETVISGLLEHYNVPAFWVEQGAENLADIVQAEGNADGPNLQQQMMNARLQNLNDQDTLTSLTSKMAQIASVHQIVDSRAQTLMDTYDLDFLQQKNLARQLSTLMSQADSRSKVTTLASLGVDCTKGSRVNLVSALNIVSKSTSRDYYNFKGTTEELNRIHIEEIAKHPNQLISVTLNDPTYRHRTGAEGKYFQYVKATIKGFGVIIYYPDGRVVEQLDSGQKIERTIEDGETFHNLGQIADSFEFIDPPKTVILPDGITAKQYKTLDRVWQTLANFLTRKSGKFYDWIMSKKLHRLKGMPITDEHVIKLFISKMNEIKSKLGDLAPVSSPSPISDIAAPFFNMDVFIKQIALGNIPDINKEISCIMDYKTANKFASVTGKKIGRNWQKYDENTNEYKINIFDILLHPEFFYPVTSKYGREAPKIKLRYADDLETINSALNQKKIAWIFEDQNSFNEFVKDILDSVDEIRKISSKIPKKLIEKYNDFIEWRKHSTPISDDEYIGYFNTLVEMTQRLARIFPNSGIAKKFFLGAISAQSMQSAFGTEIMTQIPWNPRSDNIDGDINQIVLSFRAILESRKTLEYRTYLKKGFDIDYMKNLAPFVIASARDLDPKKFLNRYFSKRSQSTKTAYYLELFLHGVNSENINTQQILCLQAVIEKFSELNSPVNEEDIQPIADRFDQPIVNRFDFKFSFNNFKDLTFDQLLANFQKLDNKLHERQVLTPFLLLSFFLKEKFFKNPVYGGPLKHDPLRTYFSSKTSPPISAYGKKRTYCMPDMLIQILASNNLFGNMLIEAIDQISVDYIFRNILRHETLSILGFMPQIQIVKNQEFWEATARVPSMIARMAPLLTTNDFWIIGHIFDQNYDTIKADIEDQGKEFSFQTFIEYFARFAPTWIPNNFLGKTYGTKNKILFAKKIMNLFGYTVDMGSEERTGTLEPFMFPYHDDQLGDREILIDMELFWIQFNYGNDPITMMVKLKEYMKKDYGTITLEEIDKSYTLRDTKVDINIPEVIIKKRKDYIKYLGRIQASKKGDAFYFRDKKYSRTVNYATFIENFNPGDPGKLSVPNKVRNLYNFKNYELFTKEGTRFYPNIHLRIKNNLS
jgi:hypothetical protein